MLPVPRVNLVVQILNHLAKLFLSFLVQVGDCDPSGKYGLVGVGSSLVRSSLGGQVVQFDRSDSIVDPLDDSTGDFDRIDIVGIETVA